jgi:hypothetical protein
LRDEAGGNGGGEMTDQAFLQAIQDFKAAQVTPQGVGTDICPLYQKVRPILEGILPFLKLIPVYGQTIAEALTALMAVLDKLCPMPPAPSPAKG